MRRSPHDLALVVPEVEPTDHLVEQLALRARDSTPSEAGPGRVTLAVAAGAGVAVVSIGGAWATGAVTVPGLPSPPVEAPRVPAPAPTKDIAPPADLREDSTGDQSPEDVDGAGSDAQRKESTTDGRGSHAESDRPARSRDGQVRHGGPGQGSATDHVDEEGVKVPGDAVPEGVPGDNDRADEVRRDDDAPRSPTSRKERSSSDSPRRTPLATDAQEDRGRGAPDADTRQQRVQQRGPDRG